MPQQRKRNGEPTVRQDKLSKQNVILYLCGIIPAVWLGLLIAPCLKDGLPGLVQQFGSVMQNPFQIQLCEDSVKTVLTLLLMYGIAIGVYLSTEHNYRRREEHGSAKWGTAGSVNKKYANKDKTENKLLTQNVAIGLDGRKHRRNLNVLVCGGSGAGKTRFYAHCSERIEGVLLMPVMVFKVHVLTSLRAGRQVVVSPFTPYWFSKWPFWPFFRKLLKNIFFAAHAALLSFCSGGCSFQNEGRRGAAARGEKVPWMTKSTYKGSKTFIGAQ